MFLPNMVTQRMPRPETFATCFTGIGYPSDMVRLNVTWHHFQWQLLSTNIAAESEKAKTFRIARFPPQKLSG